MTPAMTRRAALAALAGLALTAAGCGGGSAAASPAPTATSGIQGTAQITMQGGAGFIGQPPAAPHPYPDATIAVQPEGGGAEITRVHVNADASFRIPLAPGTYRLVPVLSANEQSLAISGQSQTLTVTAGQFTAVVVNYTQAVP